MNFGIRNYSLWMVGREWSLPNRDTAKHDCQCGYNLSQKSIDFHDILNQPNGDFYLIFFGKSRIIIIESLEAGAKVVLTTFRLPQLAIGQTLVSQSCSSRQKTLNTKNVFFYVYVDGSAFIIPCTYATCACFVCNRCTSSYRKLLHVDRDSKLIYGTSLRRTALWALASRCL